MFETTSKIAKNILVYKIRQKKAYYIVLCNILYNINYFLATPKAKAMLEPIEKSDYKSSHLANLNKKHLSDNNEDTKIPDIKQMILINDSFISERTTFIQSTSDIQFS